MGLFPDICIFEHISYKQIISICKFQFLWKPVTDWNERFDLFMLAIFTCLWINRMNSTRYLLVMELIVCISDITKFQLLALVMLSCHLIYSEIFYFYMRLTRALSKWWRWLNMVILCQKLLSILVRRKRVVWGSLDRVYWTCIVFWSKRLAFLWL